MFCIHCGKGLPDEGSFCLHCGAPRAGVPTEEPKPEPNEKKSKSNPQKQSGTFSKTSLFPRIKKLPRPAQFALGLTALIVVGVLALVSIEQILVNQKVKCPDPVTFFSLSEKEVQYYSLYHGSYDYFFHQTYPAFMDAETAWDALKEFRVLLEEYGAEVSLEDETNSQYNRYSMEADFGQVAIFDNSHRKFSVMYYLPEERCFFNYWDSDFNFVPAGTYSGAGQSEAAADTEQDASQPLSPEPEPIPEPEPVPAPEPEPIPEPEPVSEPKEDSDDTSSNSSGWVDCPNCYGGNCTACNGRGGKDSYSPGLPREWDPCWKCNGDGDCSKCNGFGKVLG